MVSKPNTRKNAKSNSFTYFAKFVKFFFILFMIITMVGALYVAKVVLDIAEEAPEVSINRFLSLNEPSIVLDDEGNHLDETELLIESISSKKIWIRITDDLDVGQKILIKLTYLYNMLRKQDLFNIKVGSDSPFKQRTY